MKRNNRAVGMLKDYPFGYFLCSHWLESSRRNFWSGIF